MTKKASKHNKDCDECKKCQKERKLVIVYMLAINILIAINFANWGWKAFTNIWYLWMLIPLIVLFELMDWPLPWEKRKISSKKPTEKKKNK